MDGLNGNRHQRNGWGGKMKNREEWRLIVQKALSCSAEGNKGRKNS
jgi:hypothetical protein